MSGGRRIDDHKFWAGGAHEGSVFPKGAHTKKEESANGAGSLSHYEDTTETIKEQQMMGERKIHSNKHKTGYRN